MHEDMIENTLEQYEGLVEKLTTLIRDELAASQKNEFLPDENCRANEDYSYSYRMGKNTAYAKVLGVITTELQIIENQWEQEA